MRRGRNLREYRQKVLQERNKSLTVTRVKKERRANTFRDRLRATSSAKQDYSVLPANHPFLLKDFQHIDDYSYSLDRSLVVCHVIESLGLGGAQTMMLELILGLNKYFGKQTKNICVYLNRREVDKNMYDSYNVETKTVRPLDFKDFCVKNNVDVVVQHRIAISKCLKHYLPTNVKYVLINHTWHNLKLMSDFIKSDVYVSVCNFLHEKTFYPEFIHPSRRLFILNGVENDYITDIPSANSSGELISGRCHRMVPSKFKTDSLQWMKNVVLKHIPGFTHYLIGSNKEAKALSKKYSFLGYLGGITDRFKKMSMIKSWDVYFYETFQEEGASVAILESLACGVPVLCKRLGGCAELVKNGTNGFLVRDRSEFLIRLSQLKNPDYLSKMKEQVIADFNNRLHIKHTACKYVQVFEALIANNSHN